MVVQDTTPASVDHYIKSLKTLFCHHHQHQRPPSSARLPLMEASPSQLQFQFGFLPISIPRKSSCTKNGPPPLSNATKVSHVQAGVVPRRLFVLFIGLSPVVFSYDPALAAYSPELKEPQVIGTVKLDSGVKFQDIIDGEGVEALEGDVVEVNYVCRRSNGYFVYSTVDQFSGESKPAILPLDESQTIKGLKEVVVGMKAGGK